VDCQVGIAHSEPTAMVSKCTRDPQGLLAEDPGRLDVAQIDRIVF
jgi:hypothetical protein